MSPACPALVLRAGRVLLLSCACLAPMPGHAQDSPAAASQTEQRWSIAMQDAEIGDFIEQVARISGQTFVIDPRVRGQVNVLSEAQLSLAEVHQLFLAVLATQGYSLIGQGQQARIVPSPEAKTEAPAPDSHGAAHAWQTRVLQVQHSAASELIPLLRPLLSQSAHLAALASSNSLIISDRKANIERMQRLLQQLDSASANDYSVYDMRHAWVDDAAEALNQALNRGQPAGTGATQVIADSRTNRLIVLGPPQARAKLIKLAQALDIEPARSANTRVIRLRHSDAKALAETLGDLGESLQNANAEQHGKPARVLIRADEGLNALVLLADPQHLMQLEAIIRQLDVARAQVLVEAAIVEVSGELSDALGVQWALDRRGASGGLAGVNFANSGLSVGTLLGALEQGKTPNLPNGAIIGLGNGSFGALITALSSSSHNNLLSTPSLLTLDNQQAEILVGQNVPFQTGSYSTAANGANNPFNTIERKDIGVSLKVTPHISQGQTLRLEIEQEISSLAPSAQQNALDLVTNKRSIKTSILADNGQVIVLGGLIQDDLSRSDSKVPLLGDMPLLGRLFRSSTQSKVKRNLMVFIKPTVLRDSSAAHSLSQGKYNSIRVLGQPLQHASKQLPATTGELFDAAQPAAAAIDLRPGLRAAEPSIAAQAFAAPAQPLIEHPKGVEQTAPSLAVGGDTPVQQPQAAPTIAPAPPREQPSKQPDTARYSVQLVEGSSEAFMQAMLSRHPQQPLRLAKRQQQGQDEFALLYGDYANRATALLALQQLPSQLPQRSARVVAQQGLGQSENK